MRLNPSAMLRPISPMASTDALKLTRYSYMHQHQQPALPVLPFEPAYPGNTEVAWDRKMLAALRMLQAISSP